MARPALDWCRLDPAIHAFDRLGFSNRAIASRLGISERSVYLRKSVLGMQKRIPTTGREVMRHAA